ncbi:NAD(P)H dehydrogenase [quinone] 1-like [Protopterus annectens]|uniref:NAD(P)H dehydrogenase [quinone] 1-like n=1 Tax=Protopterus annectens TaxID=7888 RepID=UPI001CFABE33|nr:NAD(P)H dehydrogenase [quinone] 1-like [Protopterus annectens]
MASKVKNVLIVLAHEEKNSFNSALKNIAVETLQKKGWKITISDLYAMKFNPIASRNDITGSPKNPEHFSYADETCSAWKDGYLSEDIVKEQNKLLAADLVIFQFPIFWFGMPAIMKGWIDRVFTRGFAYTFQTMYDNGPFQKKRAVISVTTGGIQSMYSSKGLNGDINVILWPIQHGMLHFTGFQVLSPQISYCPGHASPLIRGQMLEEWKSRLEMIWEEKPVQFVPDSMFDMSFEGGFVLKKEVEDANAESPYGLSVGQHMGKAIPLSEQQKSKKKTVN